MRFRPFLLLSLPVLLVGCNPDPEPGPRVDLVGSTRFLSASRILSLASGTTAADTFTTRMFAEAPGRDAAVLKRLRITVQYSPTRYPFIYPAPYNPDRTPNDAPLVYLDTLLPSGLLAAAFQFTANNRSTSGKAIWKFEAEDVNGRVNSRSYQLTLRNNDSALAYHPYLVRLESPSGFGARRFLELRSGLTFPGYTVYQTPENQKLVDLVYLPVGNAPTLAAPNDALLNLTRFTTRKNPTLLRRTALDATGFSAVTTAAGLLNAFNAGTAFPDGTRTGTLAVNQVIAFRTAGDSARTGLLIIDELQTAPIPAIRMRVRITKDVL